MPNFLIKVVATGFYTGYSPVAPGTAASALAVLLFWGIGRQDPLFFVGLAVALTPIGVWTAGRAEHFFGHDGRQIVIDEIIGMLVALAWLPQTPVVFGLGFVCFRILDITKPFPVNRSQKLPGGWGIVADDVIAAIYTNMMVRILLVLIDM